MKIFSGRQGEKRQWKGGGRCRKASEGVGKSGGFGKFIVETGTGNPVSGIFMVKKVFPDGCFPHSPAADPGGRTGKMSWTCFLNRLKLSADE